MSLREELADRFAALARHYLLEQDARINARGAMYEWDRILAEECIRQMEWAREHCQHRYGWNIEGRTLDERTTLTIAPDDWKPE